MLASDVGCVGHAVDSVGTGDPGVAPLPPHIANLIAPILPAVARATEPDGTVDPLEVGREHLRDTVAELLERSELISDAIAAGTLAVVGANYRLAEGLVVPDVILGDVDRKANPQ